MSEYVHRLENMTVTATSPDRRITARVAGRGHPTIGFTSHEAFESYRDQSELSEQIAAAITRVSAGAAQGRRALLDEYSRHGVSDEPHWDATRRRFHQERDSLPVTGVSAKQVVVVSSAGLRSWHVLISPGALGRLDAGTLCAEVNQAVQSAHREYARLVFGLKRKYFGSVGPGE